VLGDESELAPQRMRDVRRRRVERTQQDAHALAQHRGIGRGSGERGALERVQQLHRTRDHGVYWSRS